ncbi:MAG: IS4 family transposase, partial [Paracoccaceae bacterium]
SHGARGVRVRRLGGDRAGEIRFTRFLRNPSVTSNEIVETAFARTQAACAERDVLAVQDTTVTRSSRGGGSFMHAMIAVDADSGAVLGALDAQFLERSEGGRASRRSRAFENRQSVRWLDAARKAGQIEGATRVTVVADREADMFELFAHRPDHVDLLVRATHDRVLMGGGKLVARIANGPRQGYMALDLPAARGARTAHLSIRFGKFDLRPPRENRKTCPDPVSMVYVDMHEETPPEGQTPVHWRLLTTLEVETVADALDVAARYAKRWKIEDLFRTMKRKGFDIENLRIADAAPRNLLILACFVAATVVMQMVAARDGRRLRPLTDAFDPEDRSLVEALSCNLEGSTERQKNPHVPGSLAFATWVCARLGGWTGYYGKPGPIVVLRGWAEFQTIKQGVALGQGLSKWPPENV